MQLSAKQNQITVSKLHIIQVMEMLIIPPKTLGHRFNALKTHYSLNFRN